VGTSRDAPDRAAARIAWSIGSRYIDPFEVQVMKPPRVRLTISQMLVAVALCGLGFLLACRPVAVAGMTPNLIDPPGGGVFEVIVRRLMAPDW
jgi:hypothetical protein